MGYKGSAMGKSIRSKVKKKFRSIKREALEPAAMERNKRIAEKDKEAMQKMSLNPKLAASGVIDSSMNMALEVREKSEHQFGKSTGKRIRKKSRKPPNAKRENMKKKVAT